MNALINGDQEMFQTLLQEFIINSMSSFDLSANEIEKSYHLFILGLLVQFHDSFQVKSNRESGYGRYDIMLIPRNPAYQEWYWNLKKSMKIARNSRKAANNALEQIKNKHYIAELHDRDILHVNLFGIAFSGKKVLVLAQKKA